MKKNDDIKAQLALLSIPQPRDQAVQDIIRAAAQTPHPSMKWIAAMRRLRAWLYVPQMRYLIMASVVLTVIALGSLSDNSPFMAPNQPEQTVAATDTRSISPHTIPDELLLYDVEFEEEWMLAGL